MWGGRAGDGAQALCMNKPSWVTPRKLGCESAILPRNIIVRHICAPPLPFYFYYAFDDCRRRWRVAACTVGVARPSQMPPVGNDHFNIGPSAAPGHPTPWKHQPYVFVLWNAGVGAPERGCMEGCMGRSLRRNTAAPGPDHGRPGRARPTHAYIGSYRDV